MSKATDLFIQKHSSAVINSVKGTGYFPSIKMAQMIIESSGRDENGKFTIGRGLAVRKANNYFGIKADKGWKGPKVALNTPKDGQKVSYFRVYSSAQDSLVDHTIFLLRNPRYKKNGVFAAKNINDQAAALQKAGYSESPTYSKALLKIIKAYNLESLDSATAKTSGKKSNAGLVVLGVAAIAVTAIALNKDKTQR